MCFVAILPSPHLLKNTGKCLTELRRVDVRSQKDVDKWLSARQFRADYVPLLKWNIAQATLRELMVGFERD